MIQFLLEGFAENVPKAGKKCWKALQEKKGMERCPDYSRLTSP